MEAGSRQVRRILVVANETVGGQPLIDTVKRRAEEAHEKMQPFKVTVVCPQNQPKQGYVIHDETSATAAQNRLAMTLAALHDVGIVAEGEVMDPDPYSATMDALAHYGADEIVISTFPETRSGWLRRDLIDRVRQDTGLPVEHVVVDFDTGRPGEVTRTLVVANQTVEGEELIGRLQEKAAQSPHSFIVITPGSDADSRARLAHTLERLTGEGMEAVGQVMDRDPYTAIVNALRYYSVDEIVISTLPETRSGWMRGDLISRVRNLSHKPVEHVVVGSADPAHQAHA